MKRNITKQAGMLLAACLIAAPAGARKTKIDSVDAIAHLLAVKLPHEASETVYVGMPIWMGKDNHYLLCKKIGEELEHALAAADPADKVVTSAEAAAIMSKVGAQPLDVYVDGGMTARLIGASLFVKTEIRRKRDGLALTVEATAPDRKKRYAKIKGLLPISPQVLALLAQPDLPIKDSSGTYLAGVGGVGEPRCEDCPSPQFPAQAAKAMVSGTLLFGLTVGTDGKVSHLEILKDPKVPGGVQSALETIRSWKFRPARGPDGKPVPVRLIAEIRFRIRS